MGFSDRRMIRMLPRSFLTGCSSKLLLMIRIEPKSGWTSDDADDLLRTLKDPKSGVLTERRIILIKLTHKISGRDCIPQMSSKFLSKGYYPVVFI